MKEQHEKTSERSGLHPRNPHRGRYDFPGLIAVNPALEPLVRNNPLGEPTIDFADAVAVKELNRALLFLHYGIKLWDIPPGYLCPPVPGRADYIHYVADLLAETNGGEVPRGKQIRVLDIGVGANCVFPIIGHHEYGWHFVGVDIDPVSVTTAQQIVKFNAVLKGAVEIRLQRSPASIFTGIWSSDEKFDVTICNPPFHSSKADADAKTARKLRNLGLQTGAAVSRNFGGQKAELFVEGGELAFILRMISQSVGFGQNCRWFTTVVSAGKNLKPIRHALQSAKALEVKVIPVRQGQKTSQIVAWTFLPPILP